MIKAVLFDLDGTLINSLSDLAISTNYVLNCFGFPQHNVEEFNYFVGDGIPKLIERALPEESRDNETKEKCLDLFMNHYREHYLDTTYVYDGILSVLKDLKSMGMKLAVVSNKAQEMVEKIVSELFPDMFDVVTGKQAGYPAKPNPALTLKVVSLLGEKTDECILIGDSGMDAAAAKNAGMNSIGVLWGFREKQELIQNGAKYIAAKPKDILEIIKGMNDGKSNC